MSALSDVLAEKAAARAALMAAPAVDTKLNADERAVAWAIGGTYLAWITGLLYFVGPLLGWWLAWRTARAWYLAPALPAAQRPRPLPAVLWTWPLCMGWLLVVLLVGHVNWDLGLAQTLKSVVGWAKGWALLALFPIAGWTLPIRIGVLTRAVGWLGLQTLILLPLFVAAPFVGVPQHELWTSPLAAVGGGDDDFFSIIVYTLEPGIGTPRWQFFAPWAPLAGMVAVIHFLLARTEPDARWRWTATVAAVLMALLTTSRLAVIALVAIIPLTWLVGRLRHAATFAWAAPLALLCAWLWPQIGSAIDAAGDAFNGARANSSRVRTLLGHIARTRWENEAFWFGHGTVEHGPHPVEFMPIGSHHTWYGLLFVKGLLGLIGFALPMVWTLLVCARDATRGRVGRLGLAMVLVYWFYSFGENLEVVSDLAWPALLATGIALRMAAAGEPLPGPQGKLWARWWRSGRG